MNDNSSPFSNAKVEECCTALCCLFIDKQTNTNRSNQEIANQNSNTTIFELQATLGFAHSNVAIENSTPVQISMNVSANIDSNKNSSNQYKPNSTPQVFVNKLITENNSRQL